MVEISFDLFYDRNNTKKEAYPMKPIQVRNLEIGTGMPKICVPIVERTKEEIIQRAKEICETPADLVEWRADWFEQVLEIEAIKDVLQELCLVLEKRPLLFTIRTQNEGGECKISFSQYREILLQVAKSKQADMIDVEVYMHEQVPELVQELKKTGVVIVGSNHDFEKTPQKREMMQTLGFMQYIGADVSKLAVMPQNKQDVLALLSATENMMTTYESGPIITMAMSDIGSISRVAGETFGSCITFGSLEKSSAPGQIDVWNLHKILQILHDVTGE